MSLRKLTSQNHLPKGFTLVTVIIIGLLAVIAVMKLAGSRDLAESNYLKNSVSILASAVQRVITTDGSFL